MKLPGFMQFTPQERRAILALLLFTGGGGLLIEIGRRFPVYFSGLRPVDGKTAPAEAGPDSASAVAESLFTSGSADSVAGEDGGVSGSAFALSGLSGGDARPDPVHRPPREAPRASYPIDINRAGEKTLTLLPGIGPRLASRITADREANGPFKSVDDLARVKGIGPATVARLRPMITSG